MARAGSSLVVVLWFLPCSFLNINDTVVAAAERKIQQTANGQSSTSDPVNAAMKSISPQAIEWFIDLNDDADLREIWRWLGIEGPNDRSYKCGGSCSAETLDMDAYNGFPADVIVLRLSFGLGYFYQYLFFQKISLSSDQNGWKLLGSINSHDQRYAAPTHRLESGDGHSWFVLRELWGRGSDIVHFGESWYDLGPGQLKRVLSYPLEGRSNPCLKKLGYSYKAMVVRYGLENGVYTIPIQLLITYNISDCSSGNESLPLFTKHQRAYYIWSNKEQQFVLDGTRSDVTEERIRAVYNREEMSPDKFLQVYFNELFQLAKEGKSKQKKWLREFVIGISESDGKAALQRALQQ